MRKAITAPSGVREGDVEDDELRADRGPSSPTPARGPAVAHTGTEESTIRNSPLLDQRDAGVARRDAP